MPVSRIIVILIVFGCILCIIFTGPAMARGGGSGSSSTGSPATGEPQQSGARGTSHGGGTGQGPAIKGGISNAPGSGQIASQTGSISYPATEGEVTDNSQQQFSGGRDFGTGDVQQSLYSRSTPYQYWGQASPYGYGNLGYGNVQSNVYGGGYGAVVGQAPAPGSGQSVQALAQPGAGESCMSTCTESYTPYECSAQYCTGK
jgi:hypothetical protein